MFCPLGTYMHGTSPPGDPATYDLGQCETPAWDLPSPPERSSSEVHPLDPSPYAGRTPRWLGRPYMAMAQVQTRLGHFEAEGFPIRCLDGTSWQSESGFKAASTSARDSVRSYGVDSLFSYFCCSCYRTSFQGTVSAMGMVHPC